MRQYNFTISVTLKQPTLLSVWTWKEVAALVQQRLLDPDNENGRRTSDNASPFQHAEVKPSRYMQDVSRGIVVPVRRAKPGRKPLQSAKERNRFDDRLAQAVITRNNNARRGRR